MTRSGTSREAVLYARVSSKDQEREGFSIPAQLKLLRHYAEGQGLAIVQEFVDVETAKAAGRTGFGAMLAILTAHPSCATILVEKTDRLYRNIRDWITVDDLDLTVHFVKENVIVSKASRSSEKFIHGIKVQMAKNYVDNLSEEMKKGMREKAEQGHWPSVAPIGYVNDLKTHRIAVDLVRGPVVTQVFAVYANGGYSLKGLGRGLCDGPDASPLGSADDEGRDPPYSAESHLCRGVRLARQAVSRRASSAGDARDVRARAGGPAPQAARPLSEAAACLHGPVDLCPVRLFDDG